MVFRNREGVFGDRKWGIWGDVRVFMGKDGASGREFCIWGLFGAVLRYFDAVLGTTEVTMRINRAILGPFWGIFKLFPGI